MGKGAVGCWACAQRRLAGWLAGWLAGGLAGGLFVPAYSRGAGGSWSRDMLVMSRVRLWTRLWRGYTPARAWWAASVPYRARQTVAFWVPCAKPRERTTPRKPHAWLCRHRLLPTIRRPIGARIHGAARLTVTRLPSPSTTLPQYDMAVRFAAALALSPRALPTPGPGSRLWLACRPAINSTAAAMSKCPFGE